MYEEYEYKSLKERMEDCEDSFIDALLESPLFNNGHKKETENDIVDSITDSYTSVKYDDILPF